MEPYVIAIEKSKKELKVADHMMNTTYKLVKDPKILVLVMQRLMASLTYSMAAILYHESYYKRIPQFEERFDQMFELFKARVTRRYHINIEYITLIQDVRDILREHRKSPVEFTRSGRFVICSDSYRTRVISEDMIRDYIRKAGLFLTEAENMVKING